MSKYTKVATCIVPAPLGIIAAAVGKALDPDVGGAKSFVPYDAKYDAKGVMTAQPTKLVTRTPVTAEYAAVLPYLLADPASLLATITLDRDTRWAGMVIPTLAEVTSFCASAVLTIS